MISPLVKSITCFDEAFSMTIGWDLHDLGVNGGVEVVPLSSESVSSVGVAISSANTATLWLGLPLA